MFMKKKCIVMALSFVLLAGCNQAAIDYQDPHPFGQATRWAKNSDNVAIGKWWQPNPKDNKREAPMRKW